MNTERVKRLVKEKESICLEFADLKETKKGVQFRGTKKITASNTTI